MNITLSQVYTPTTDTEDEEREEFYNNPKELIDIMPKKDAVIVLGDFNSKTGNIKTPGVTGDFGLGDRNEAGDMLVQFCIEHNMTIMNTCFQQPKRHLYTWTSPNGLYRNQIDYILCRRRWKSMIQSV